MSLNAVKSNISFAESDSSAFKNAVYEAIGRIYSSSVTGAAMLERSLRAPLVIVETFSEGSGAVPNSNKLRINNLEIENSRYISPDGVL